MKNVRVLDCTLRDGGRIIDCAFEDQEIKEIAQRLEEANICLLYTSPSPRDGLLSRMPSSA